MIQEEAYRMEDFFDKIFSGNFDEELVKDKLVEMHQRGESVEEIVAGARSMMRHMNKIEPRPHHYFSKKLYDVVGTGGDGKGSINISTIAALVVAGANYSVAKHCNRGVSSKFGSVDLLEELGVNVNITPEKTEKIIGEIGIGFMYAPLYHPAMKNVAKIRKEIGHRTIFNLLGPLTNPANAHNRLIGAYSTEAAKKLVYSAKELRIERALVVHAPREGLDEISCLHPTDVFELQNLPKTSPYIDSYRFYPGENRAEGDLTVSSAEESAEICRKILDRKELSKREKAMRASIILNAGRIISLDPFSKKSMEMAEKSIESGAAARKLEKLIEATN